MLRTAREARGGRSIGLGQFAPSRRSKARINLWGVIYGTKAFLPLMLERRSGCIVNLSSILRRPHEHRQGGPHGPQRRRLRAPTLYGGLVGVEETSVAIQILAR